MEARISLKKCLLRILIITLICIIGLVSFQLFNKSNTVSAQNNVVSEHVVKVIISPNMSK